MTRARILLLGGLAGLCVLRGVTVIAAPPVAAMYVDTMAREKAIRVWVNKAASRQPRLSMTSTICWRMYRASA